MPKIADIEPTPNPNAVKFILREALSWGIRKKKKKKDDGVKLRFQTYKQIREDKDADDVNIEE